MENKFLSISRKFILFLTGLAFIAILIGAFIALTKFSNSPDETIKITKIDSNDYFTKKEEKQEIKQNIQETDDVKTVVQKEQSKLDKIIDETAEKTLKNLNMCETKLLGSEILVDSYNITSIKDFFKNRISKNIISISDEDKSIEFFKLLNNDIDNIVKNYQYIKDNSLECSSYIDWFYKQYIEQLISEQDRIKSEILASKYAKAEALDLVSFIGIAFGVFVFLTIILVLFKIEINTRKEEDIK
ncbi:hypothetical protein [Aliarcobacter cryaerophilus]|uniref:hypothetical protein n=1 Tax=Aliarcobacter cryaerophilus TaxID=28198 RepID=UPI0021B1DFAE|nr:hypothetical protein [Aliarcobacter cryaerophilus]MCT7443607.1 hypothetical protein [Aliarcobacter cryaerophilus]MCT7478905.1 hypothetical protein [Aliarcobacter cryaerophilus]